MRTIAISITVLQHVYWRGTNKRHQRNTATKAHWRWLRYFLNVHKPTHTHTHEHMHNLFLISGLASLMTFMMIELLYGPAHHSFPTGSAQNRLSWWVCSFNSTFTFENIVWFALMFNSDINTFLIYRYKTRLYSLSLRL